MVAKYIITSYDYQRSRLIVFHQLVPFTFGIHSFDRDSNHWTSILHPNFISPSSVSDSGNRVNCYMLSLSNSKELVILKRIITNKNAWDHTSTLLYHDMRKVVNGHLYKC